MQLILENRGLDELRLSSSDDDVYMTDLLSKA